MLEPVELDRQFALVVGDKGEDYHQAINLLRRWLENDPEGELLGFIQRRITDFTGEPRGRLAFLLAERYRITNDLDRLEQLFADDDRSVKESVLNALWSEPGPGAGPRIVAMALEGARHPSPEVRTMACYVFQNQAAYRVDVSAAVEPLGSLLKDQAPRVRHQAAYAAGNLAKRRYDVSSLLPQLRRNVKHKDVYVRESAAWALWQMSRHKHDLAAAVPELAQLLADDHDYDKPRKNAAGALLHHARKSPAHAADVAAALDAVSLDERRREVQRFLSDFAKVNRE